MGKRYLGIILITFLMGFVFVGLVGPGKVLYGLGKLGRNPVFIFIYQGGFWGFTLSSFANGIMIMCEVYKKAGKKVKILMKILFPFTLPFAMWIGVFSLLPMVFVQIKKKIIGVNDNYSKSKDCLEIKPAYGNLIWFILVVILQTICYIKVKNMHFELSVTISLLFGLIMGIVDVQFLANLLLDCRYILIEREGCILRLFNKSKKYRWEEIPIKRLECGYHNLNGSIPTRGVFFSIHPVNKKMSKDPRKFCLYKNPFAYFYVYLKNEKVYSFHNRMCVDQELFFKKISQWGVQLTVEE